jgi:hypothetical protein
VHAASNSAPRRETKEDTMAKVVVDISMSTLSYRVMGDAA